MKKEVNELLKNKKTIYNYKFTSELLHFNDEKLFRNICKTGDMMIIKYLLSLKDKYGKIDIHSRYDEAFINACNSGNLNLVKYLVLLENEYGKIEFNSNILCIIFCQGNCHITKYILSFGYYILPTDNMSIFEVVCLYSKDLDKTYLNLLLSTYQPNNIYEYVEFLKKLLNDSYQCDINIIKYIYNNLNKLYKNITIDLLFKIYETKHKIKLK